MQERMFSELFLHLSLLLGFPTMLEGLTTLRTIAAKPAAGPVKAERIALVKKRGMNKLRRIYGSTLNRLLANLRSLHEDVPEMIIRDVYGRTVSRRGLSLREREIVNVAVLSIQQLDQQLHSHIRGALALRVSRKSLRRIINMAARIAHTDPKISLNLLSSLARSRKSSR
jgi:4-carboxymuconolactone decarboxylase